MDSEVSRRICHLLCSVKSLWSLGVLAVFIVSSLSGRPIPDWASATISMVVGFYFAQSIRKGEGN